MAWTMCTRIKFPLKFPCLVLVDSFGGKGFNETVSREKVLIKNLLDRYAKYGRVGRPLANTSDYIGVEFALSLIQVINLDEKDQVLTISVWYQYVSVDNHCYTLFL